MSTPEWISDPFFWLPLISSQIPVITKLLTLLYNYTKMRWLKFIGLLIPILSNILTYLGIPGRRNKFRVTLVDIVAEATDTDGNPETPELVITCKFTVKSLSADSSVSDAIRSMSKDELQSLTVSTLESPKSSLPVGKGYTLTIRS